ncbi:MAG: aminotransferase class V-fold PLP-dependent enzyme [Gemmatimonadetes bacterium]|nr:MAG: aminotransferase class V-fold PLP-dependent enzyme [Gemmatimonadota bacterium]
MKLDNYVKVMINRMARATHTPLTPRHEEILTFAYHYYNQHRVGPLYYTLKKALGTTKTEINRLFPNGLNSVYTWVGIPIQTADSPCKPIANITVDDYREVYLDHNATTYIRPEVAQVLVDYYRGNLGFANPSSSTRQGKKAFDLINSARSQIAQGLGVEPEEFIFTGSGSEANNTAIKGIAFQHWAEKGHLITTQVEHSSVLRTMEFLETLGFDVTYLEVDPEGRVSPETVANHMRTDTRLVAVMMVNNEIGTINPIRGISEVCRQHNVPLFVDAVQGLGKIPLHPKTWGVSLMSVSGHKIYAPKGIGGLFVDHRITLAPLIHGGEQELGLRAGTENVGHILGFAAAVRLALAEMETEHHRLSELHHYFLTQLKQIEPNIILNGSATHRVPHNMSIGFPQVDTAALLLSLNEIGISVSAGSACSSGKIETSHVLKAIRADTASYGTVRFSMGLKTTKADLDYLLRYLPSILTQIKETAPLERNSE